MKPRVSLYIQDQSYMPTEKESFEFFVREWDSVFDDVKEKPADAEADAAKPDAQEERPEGGDAGVAEDEGKEVCDARTVDENQVEVSDCTTCCCFRMKSLFRMTARKIEVVLVKFNVCFKSCVIHFHDF